jgi:hypothetical protein
LNEHAPRYIRIVIVLAASVSACGKSTSPSGNVDVHDRMAATASGRKPCEYMKRADAEKAVGLALPETLEDVTLHECHYMTSEFYGAGITIAEWDSGCKVALASDRPAVVTNLGDEAYFIREHLFIRKGERCLSVEINGPLPDADKDDGLARVTELAHTVLPTF